MRGAGRTKERDTIRARNDPASAPMSAEIESLTVESAAASHRRRWQPDDRGALAVIAVLIAAAAHWRLNRVGDRLSTS